MTSHSAPSSFKFDYSNCDSVVWLILHVTAIDETIKLVEGIGGKVYGYKCDLADKEDVYRIAEKTRDEAGEVIQRHKKKHTHTHITSMNLHVSRSPF